jgi:hypothetical protein
MNKIKKSNKEEKKQALMTPKEKKTAKHEKKRLQDIVPFIAR